MNRRLVTLRAFHTGAIEHAGVVRHNLAFDLAATRLSAANIGAAAIHVTRRATSPLAGGVQLRAPGNDVLYGAAAVTSAPVLEVPLTPAGLADLRQATSGFFFIEAVTPDAGDDGRADAIDVDRGLMLAIRPCWPHPAPRQAGS